MNKVYDNGYQVLGNVKELRNYLNKGIEFQQRLGEQSIELKDMLEEIKDYSDDDIVMIDYDRPMGFSLYYFNNKYDEIGGNR